MKLPEFLEKQLVDFVRIYKKYYQKTFSVTLLLTIVFFLIGATLLRVSSYPPNTLGKPNSIATSLFHRYSESRVYSVADLNKIIFVFFVCLFTVSLYAFKRQGFVTGYFSFKQFFSSLNVKNIASLFGILLITVLMDYLLVKLDNYFLSGKFELDNAIYLNAMVFHLRIYIPMLLFALASSWRLQVLEKVNARKVIFLYISLWAFNEFAFEIWVWSKKYLFSLVLLPFSKSDLSPLIHNILSMPLVAFYFLGYSSAMVYSLQILETGSDGEPVGILDGIDADN